MANMITVNIEAPNGMSLEGAQIPDDYTVQKAINELVDSEQLGLPRLNEGGERIDYALRIANKNIDLSPGQRISDTGLSDNDTLQLVASHKLDAASTPPLPTLHQQPQNSNQIRIILKVLDLNRSETTDLSGSRKIGDIIRQIVQNYDLPARDKIGQLIKYKLQSKALGRFLEENTTLREAQIPNFDLLTLHREEIAGA